MKTTFVSRMSTERTKHNPSSFLMPLIPRIEGSVVKLYSGAFTRNYILESILPSISTTEQAQALVDFLHTEWIMQITPDGKRYTVDVMDDWDTLMVIMKRRFPLIIPKYGLRSAAYAILGSIPFERGRIIEKRATNVKHILSQKISKWELWWWARRVSSWLVDMLGDCGGFHIDSNGKIGFSKFVLHFVIFDSYLYSNWCKSFYGPCPSDTLSR